MRIPWVRYFFVLSLAFISGAALMVVSHRVQSTERAISKLDHAMMQERESIRILEAEWAFLNSPARLEALAASHLQLSAPEPERLISRVETAVPVFTDEDVVASSENDLQKNILPVAYSSHSLPSVDNAGAARVHSVVSSPKPRIYQEKLPDTGLRRDNSGVSGGGR
jgi:hypothetical protein